MGRLTIGVYILPVIKVEDQNAVWQQKETTQNSMHVCYRESEALP